jgi:hypothetical protein
MADASNRESEGLQAQPVIPTMQYETKTALDGADAVEGGQEPSVKVDTAAQGAKELKRQAGLEAPQSQKTSEQLAAEQLDS